MSQTERETALTYRFYEALRSVQRADLDPRFEDELTDYERQVREESRRGTSAGVPRWRPSFLTDGKKSDSSEAHIARGTPDTRPRGAGVAGVQEVNTSSSASSAAVVFSCPAFRGISG